MLEVGPENYLKQEEHGRHVGETSRLTRAYNPRMAYLKPISAGLCASAITYLCFLTWIHMKATSVAEERGTTGLIAVAGGAAYVLHSPAFWALAIVAFGVAFFLFRDA
jgi:hypothetical protein